MGDWGGKEPRDRGFCEGAEQEHWGEEEALRRQGGGGAESDADDGKV